MASSADETTTTRAPLETTEGSAVDAVVVELSPEETDPLGAIGLRVAHLGSIGLWLIPVFAGVFGRKSRAFIVLALAGIALTAATGVSLMLWSAPVAFPGSSTGAGWGTFHTGRPIRLPFSSRWAVS